MSFDAIHPSEATMDMVGVAEQAMTLADPASFIRALLAAAAALPSHPRATSQAFVKASVGFAGLAGAVVRRAVGDEADGPCRTNPGDRRFSDRAFEQNPYYFALQQSHLLAE